MSISNTHERLFDRFAQAVERNEVEEAVSAARRIRANLPLHINNPGSPLYDLPGFHRRVVEKLNGCDTEAARPARKLLADFYFRPAREPFETQVPLEWRICSCDCLQQCNRAYYYHVTRFDGLKGILASGNIKALQEKQLYGAFVAMEPQTRRFGNYIIGLKKGIERECPPSAFMHRHNIGFARDIPINSDTVAYITVYPHGLEIPVEAIDAMGIDPQSSRDDQINLYCRWLQAKCCEWAGWDVPVLFPREAALHVEKMKKVNLGLPRHWGADKYNNKKPSVTPVPAASPFLPSRL